MISQWRLSATSEPSRAFVLLCYYPWAVVANFCGHRSPQGNGEEARAKLEKFPPSSHCLWDCSNHTHTLVPDSLSSTPSFYSFFRVDFSILTGTKKTTYFFLEALCLTAVLLLIIIQNTIPSSQLSFPPVSLPFCLGFFPLNQL